MIYKGLVLQPPEHNESFANAIVSLRHYTEESSGYSLRHNAQFGNTFVQLGGQISNSNGFGPNLSNPYNNFDTTVKGWSGSVEQKLFDEALSLDGGYRRDITHSDVSSTVAANPLANHDVDLAPAQVFAFGARWKIHEMLALNARYFHGDEGTPSDFSMKTKTGVPLHAEKQERVELALEAAPASSFKPTLTWFDYTIDNQKSVLTGANNSLQTYTVNGETYYYYAEADVLRRGIELAVKGDVRQSTSYSFSWTHLTTNSSTTNGVTNDGVGVSTPADYFTALLSHAWEKYRANISVKQVSSWLTSASPVGIQNADLGGYTTVDANIMRTFPFSGYRLTATLYGRNLGDERDSEEAAIPHSRSNRYGRTENGCALGHRAHLCEQARHGADVCRRSRYAGEPLVVDDGEHHALPQKLLSAIALR